MSDGMWDKRGDYGSISGELFNKQRREIQMR